FTFGIYEVEVKSSQQVQAADVSFWLCISVHHGASQCAQMNNVIAELAKEHSQVTFVKLKAD
uniref:Uncharacterized protein n=1 Tax=Erpetoichthys calabaricus TaxID=27687 RepID=A0A8C4SI48_ERPCA